MVDNYMNFEEYKLHVCSNFSKLRQHEALIWLSAIKIQGNVKDVFEERKQSEWDKLFDEVKNKPIKSRKNK